MNLSGGQKARVSLARESNNISMSRDVLTNQVPYIVELVSCSWMMVSALLMASLTLVLSAVDAHTAHAIMENCFQGDILKGRTVLLVSHHTALVSPVASYIVALDNVSPI